MKTDSYSLKRAAKLSATAAIHRLERKGIECPALYMMKDFHERQVLGLFEDNAQRLAGAKAMPVVRQGARFILQVYAAR